MQQEFIKNLIFLTDNVQTAIFSALFNLEIQIHDS